MRIIWVQGIIKMFLSKHDPMQLSLGWPYFSLGDKPSGHTTTRVIIGILYRIFLHQTPSNRIPAALRHTPSDWIHVVLWQTPSDWIHKFVPKNVLKYLLELEIFLFVFLESLFYSNRSMSVVCWINGSNYNWKHVRLTWEFPWDFLASGGPYYETLRLAVHTTNG